MPKALTEIRSLARSHTRTAIKALAGIMNCQDATAAARVAAANAILDRGWGKPKQADDNSDEASAVVHKIERTIVHPENSDSYDIRAVAAAGALQGRVRRPRFRQIAFLRRDAGRDLPGRARHACGLHSRSAADAGAILKTPDRKQDCRFGPRPSLQD